MGFNHPQEHRGRKGNGPLHDHGANRRPPRLPRRVSPLLEQPPGDRKGLVQPLHPTDRRHRPGDTYGRAESFDDRRTKTIACEVSRTGHAGLADPGDGLSSRKSRRMYLCPDHEGYLSRPDDADNTLSIRGSA
jgi:hypothetical protein